MGHIFHAIRNKEGDTNMPGRRRRWVAAAVGAVCLASVPIRAESISEWICINPERSVHWQTLATNEVDLTWTWPDGATSARLVISNMASTVVLDETFTLAKSNTLWHVFDGDIPADEDVYRLTLTFSDGTTQQTALALLKGAFGSCAVDADSVSRTWRKVSRNVVIPYDANWTNASECASSAQLTVSNEVTATAQSMRLPPTGYYGWSLYGWGYGEFALELDFMGATTNTWTALLNRYPGGTVVGVR